MYLCLSNGRHTREVGARVHGHILGGQNTPDERIVSYLPFCAVAVSMPQTTFAESHQMKARDVAHNTNLKPNDIMVYNINLNVEVTQTKSEQNGGRIMSSSTS